RRCCSTKPRSAPAPAARCRYSAGRRAWRFLRRSRTEPFQLSAALAIGFTPIWARTSSTSSCPARNSKPFPTLLELSQPRTPRWKNLRAGDRRRCPLSRGDFSRQCGRKPPPLKRRATIHCVHPSRRERLATIRDCCSPGLQTRGFSVGASVKECALHGQAKWLQAAQTLVKPCDGLDPAEIIFERDVFVRGVRVFVRQSKTEQDARHFECVVHLCDERNRSALADED